MKRILGTYDGVATSAIRGRHHERRRETSVLALALVLLTAPGGAALGSPRASTGVEAHSRSGIESTVRGASASRELPAEFETLSRLPSQAEARLIGGLEQIAATRSALGVGTYTAALSAILPSASQKIVTLPDPPPDVRSDAAALPEAVAIPAMAMAAAVVSALNQVDASVDELVLGSRGWARMVRTLINLRLDPPAAFPRSLMGPSGRMFPAPHLRAPAPTPKPASKKDGPDATTAAMLIAAALDAYLPDLREAVANMNEAGNATLGCDLLDQTPYVCIGSAADNTYTADSAFLLDLGGADTYLNRAGGAPFQAGGGLSLGASLNVDLAGDDVYSYTAPATNEVQPAQGAAVAQAVGMLVDLGGNDSYRATATLPAGAQDLNTAVIAQGASHLRAVGALFDSGGDDRYSITAPSGEAVISVAGQGVAGGCPCSAQGNEFLIQRSYGGYGGALLADGGSGDDDYILDAGEIRSDTGHAPGGSALPWRFAVGQGAGVLGTGVLADDGGKDSFVATAQAAAERDPTDVVGPVATVLAQGYVFLDGTGLLLSGHGDSDYSIRATGDGMPRLVEGSGQGAALGGLPLGIGALEDLGGNDSYDIETSRTHDVSLIADEACGCDQAAASLDFLLDPYRVSFLMGQGGAFNVGGAGILADGGGRDRYRAQHEVRKRVTLVDRLARSKAPPFLEVQSWDGSTTTAQGGGVHFAAGLLLDRNDAGGDVFELAMNNPTNAAAISEGAASPGEPWVTAVGGTAKPTTLVGQGGAAQAGAAMLLDLEPNGGSGGEPSRFEASLRSPVTTAPDPAGAFERGILPLVHGSAAFEGVGLFLGGGALSGVSSSPYRPVCWPSDGGHGGRGASRYWLDCPVSEDRMDDGSGAGADGHSASGGVMSSWAPRLETILAFTGDTPSEAPLDGKPPGPGVTRVPAEALLTDADGRPVTGATVHFSLQLVCVPSPGLRWCNEWTVRAITDESGVARAEVPLLGTEVYQTARPSNRWRISATFDGRLGQPDLPSLEAANVTRPISLS